MTGLIAISGDCSRGPDVSIVMPCLDEAKSLPTCIVNARQTLERMRAELGLSGEIVVADNGSTDGSQLIARALGARVVDVERRGYGAALIGGMQTASGTYLVMGDADGSYDFTESVAMVRALVQGADLCMGSRFKGGIETGAMPWKNRYIGNPALTFILNLFFGARVDDAHCGLRALTKDCFERLALGGSGMEFASEMIIKAALKRQKIAETPVTLRCDLRERAPHLRPWRDGWRHLRFLLMLSPAWVFAAPAAVAAALSLVILGVAGSNALLGSAKESFFGNYWIILAGALLGLSHVATLLATAGHLYGRRQGYRRPALWEARLAKWATLEAMLVSGAGAVAAGLAILLGVIGYWSGHHFAAIGNVLPAVLGTTLIVLGAQNALGGFLLAIINGNEAKFIDLSQPGRRPEQAGQEPNQPRRLDRKAG
ncbi:glycosyltransferase family 2 protein [Methylocystis sp. MJC1]|uniref:glycosyltransferase family 2 protein n=1 Tax=Methylocystis sp. MJC1 TaxID=2654282 RepID=UPI0013ED233F|nr:glycosyltransferase family 2 protein [Methylocystis sp. MJC1]KAF2990466.1 putative glycosyltransferase [Methylocystis sp. MJC1]MBU6528261.1 glycosyltransferase family 2 protein [Methylocystis sp. MJC1]UZX11168.1 glycosyltransferase family 2 protein [Methylocystis sp. MJC1]